MESELPGYRLYNSEGNRVQFVTNTAREMDTRKPEEVLAECMKKDLGIDVNPMALRMWIRWRWDRIEKLAHSIHEG